MAYIIQRKDRFYVVTYDGVGAENSSGTLTRGFADVT
jgi:hypothetical protein